MHSYEQSLRFGAGGETLVTPLGAAFAIFAIICLLLFPRKYVFSVFLMASVLIPLEQKIVVAGLHLMTFRVLILIVWIRALVSGWPRGIGKSKLDGVIVAWMIANMIIFVILWGEFDALTNRLGLMLNVFGVYFLVRVLVRTVEDVNRVITALICLTIIIAPFMVVESRTGHNYFSILGGVPEITAVRDGQFRAQGPFVISIIAGTLGAVLLPLFVGIWQQKTRRKLAAAGIVAAVAMIISCASSTPILALGGGVAALAFWRFRRSMRVFRWGVLATLVGLHLVMKAPVWALIGRVDVIGGSSGDHRFLLVDRFISHFFDWWLLGTRYTGDWGYLMGDTANEYVSEGTQGGLVTLGLFIAILVVGFQLLGRARKLDRAPQVEQKLLWALGSTLFACAVSFIGITFFDQSQVIWYTILGLIASAALAVREQSIFRDRIQPDCSAATIEEQSQDFKYENPVRSA
jgi:hypothetical protein